MPANSGDLPMRKTQHTALKKKFIESIQRYQDIERTFQQKFRQRVERQIRIGKCEEGWVGYADNSHTHALTLTL
jgi:t-SNARE complex subunit (syntaxin)